jgi:hypothetical protein
MYIDQFRKQERPEDRVHELDTINALRAKTGWVAVKEEGEQDFRLHKPPFPLELGKHDQSSLTYCAVAEVKWRNTPAGKFDTYTIDQRKLERLQERGRRDGVLALLVVSWAPDFDSCTTGGMFNFSRDRRYLNVTRLDLSKLQTTMIRRRDRQEFADPGYHVPMALFHKF